MKTVTGRVVGWVVVDREGSPWTSSLRQGRTKEDRAFHRGWVKSLRAAYGHLGPFRVAAVVIPKVRNVNARRVARGGSGR